MEETTLESYPFHSTRKRDQQVDYPVLVEYRRHLDQDRGLKVVRSQISAATCFLDFLAGRDRSPEAITKRDIDDFITEQGGYYRRETIANLASLLRSFLRFLLAHGLVEVDWAASVPRPRLFEGKRDPRYLKPHDVQRVLAGVEQASLVGKRNGAILSLLALYGLRAAEVARLALDDIAWRSMTLRVRHRKCNDAFELPLRPAVATALVNYLRVRGRSDHREVFLSSLEPLTPLKATTVSRIARRAILRAGIEVARPGSHSFRYATAQALFQAERPISEIAAVLGHRDLSSTQGYLSITAYPLRDVSLNDGEDLA